MQVTSAGICIMKCRNLDDDVVDCVISHCRNLKQIILWGCSKIRFIFDSVNNISDIAVGTLLKKRIQVKGKDQFLV